MKLYKKLNLLICIISAYSYSLSVSAKESVIIIADEISVSNQGVKLIATGNVKIQYGDYQLNTTELTYDKEKNLLSANHPIELKNKNVFKIIASSAEISDDFKKIIASHASALIEKTFYVRSQKMVRFKNGQSSFYSSIGTTCEVCPSSPVPMWQIKSEMIRHDSKKHQLHFKNARMEFLGLPVFYTPYLRIPEPGVKRATGLLTPKILTSDLLGVGLKQPFYLNLSRSSDVTFALLKTSKTNFLLETDYRKLFNFGKLDISGAAKPANKKNILDGYFQLSGNANVFNGSTLSFDATAVSDSGFLGKYGYSDTDRLTSIVTLTKQGYQSFSEIGTTYYTSLRDNTEEEYIVAPNFYTRYFTYSSDLDLFLGTEMSLIGLTKKNFDTNIRFNASIDSNKDWRTKGGLQLKGSSKISASFYHISETKDKGSVYRHFDPTLGLELTFPLYKKSYNQLDTIKPRLQLIYNPDLKLNDAIPNTDSQQVKLDQSSLFSLNRFSGLDKQEAGLRLNTGVEYTVENNGPFSYELTLGQIFREAPSTQFSEESGLSDIKSDILISGNLNYNSIFKVHGQQLYDQNLKLKHAETTLSYLQPSQTLTSGLIFFDANVSENRPTDLIELTLGLESNITKNWLANFDLRRSINENENINASLKLSYKNECADINLSFRRRFTETNTLPADTSVELTFDLNRIGDKRNSLRKSNCLIYN